MGKHTTKENASLTMFLGTKVFTRRGGNHPLPKYCSGMAATSSVNNFVCKTRIRVAALYDKSGVTSLKVTQTFSSQFLVSSSEKKMRIDVRFMKTNEKFSH